jgi:hypothetical protein
VTFSFAIAGLIIDIGGLIMIFLVSLLQGGTSVDYDAFVGLSDPFEIYGIIVSGEYGNMNNSLFQFEGKNLLGIIFEGILTIPKAIGYLIVAGITIFGAAKLWFTLMKTYLTIILQVIASPLIIMTGALPGNMNAITNWMKGLLKNVLVFPATVALINLPEALYSMNNNLSLKIPGKLVFESASEYNSDGFGLDKNIYVVIIEIVLIFMASQIPMFLETILPSNSSPAAQKAGDKTKEALTKMPLFGSLFK